MHVKTFIFKILLLIAFVHCSTPQENLLPEKILGFRLTQIIADPEASKQINELHLQNVAAEKNEIAFYEDNQNSTVIYISHYSSAETAMSEWTKMTRKISPENSVFIAGEYLDFDDLKVYRCFGMGQTHFIFAKGKQLFWLSVKTTMAMDFLLDYLKILN